MYIYIYSINLYISLSLYIYIYIEREREREIFRSAPRGPVLQALGDGHVLRSALVYCVMQVRGKINTWYFYHNHD